jgi:hypothetical protein
MRIAITAITLLLMSGCTALLVGGAGVGDCQEGEDECDKADFMAKSTQGVTVVDNQLVVAD